MTFRSALAVLRRGWRVLVAGVLLGLLAGGIVALSSPDRYLAESSVYVSGLDTVPVPGADFYINNVLVEQRATSYRDLLLSQRVLGPVAAATGAPLLPGSVAVRPGKASSVFAVTAVDGDAERAAAVASGVADRFVAVVGEVEPARVAGAPLPVRATVVDRATTGSPTGPSWEAALLAGLLAGLGAAVVWTLARATVASRRAAGGRDEALTVVGDGTGRTT